MSITYKWDVIGVKTTKVGAEEKYVVQTYWTKTGTDEFGNTGIFKGATPFDPNPEQENIILFDQLTPEIILSWIQPLVIDAYAQHVDNVISIQIAEKANPVVDTNLPWAVAKQN